MKFNTTKVAAIAILAVSANVAQAATLSAGDKLIFTSGVNTSSGAYDGAGGSFFGMDLNSNEKIGATEATGITALGPITVCSTTMAGDIDTWVFNGSTGMDFLVTALTGGTSGVGMSGWTVNWNGGDINMGVGAWQSNAAATGNVMENIGQVYTTSVGNFTWDGTNNGAFTLDYTATVPDGGFMGTQYYLHLEGTVAAVPEASTYGMMLAGLGLVGGMVARRRKMVA